MVIATGFTPIAEVAADDRSRIAFGRAGVRRDARFLVSRNESGELLLTPVSSIPTREMAVWENPDLLASVMRGTVQYVAGDLVERDDLDEDE